MKAKRGLLSKSSICIISCLVILTIIQPFRVDSLSYKNHPSQKLDSEQIICLASPNDLILEKITVRIQLSTYHNSPTHIELNVRNQGVEPINNVAIWLNGSFSSFSLNDPFGQLDYSLSQIDQCYLFNISLRSPLATNQTFFCFIQAQWQLTKLTNENPFYFHVEIPMVLPMETQLLILEIFLPANNYLIDDPLKINPVNNAVIMGDINQTVIAWFVYSPESSTSAPLVFSAKYTDGRDDNLADPENERSLFDVIYPFIAIALITGLLYYGVKKWQERAKTNQSITTSQDFILQLLKEDEILLLELILQNGGRIDQKELEQVSSFSRSKLSRHLFILEEKGLIEKISFGRTNRILLTQEAQSNLTLKETQPLDE
ncbi:MAG: helix-turn-helix transcriptional regulator [Candidatus Kariarchaeaceae archaeon]